MDERHNRIIIGIAAVVLDADPLGIWINEQSMFVRFGECLGELHVGVDETTYKPDGTYQILDLDGKGLIEFEIF